ncbi:radical SAM protein [Candidatus Pacearchaeota archaeon]|nr:radical SAM protein [Candidatus Pacearchaeota archaeon]
MNNNKMKIHFLIPPTKERNPDRLFGCNYSFFLQHNIFILYPATYLKKNGFSVKFIDCVIEEKTLNEALEEEADVYVFYSVFLSRELDLKTADIIQEKWQNKPIVFIGADPTIYPEKYCNNNRFIVRGEPEETLLALCREFSRKNKNFKKIRGLSFFNKKIINNPPRNYIKNLDKLPFPDRNLIAKPFKYFNPKFRKLPSTTMLTSRGCAFRCEFCIPNSLSFAREVEWKKYFKKKPPVAMRTPENIIQEFRLIKNQGYKSVFIVDDQFVWGKERTIKILKGIRNFGIEISLLARCDMLSDEDIVKEMALSNVKFIDLGIESFSQEILKDVRKDLDVKTIHKCVNNLKKYNIEPEVNIVLGCSPLETKKTIKNTINEVKKMDVEVVHATVCTPFPGTDFRERAIKNKWTEDRDYVPIDPGADSLIEYPHLKRKELVKSVKSVYRKHYFSPRYILKQLLKTRSLAELKNKARAGFGIFKNIIISRKK